LLAAWEEFLPGKRKRKDVAKFSLHLMDNIFALHRELTDKTYRHGAYWAFKINDPKPRDIHKASVRDRLLHHAIYRILYPYFDTRFSYDSHSCRVDKGTHLATKRFMTFARKVLVNGTKTAWVLKCDIRKFFANIDHSVLKKIIENHIADTDTTWLLRQVIDSFNTDGKIGVGLPLGNLTSQLLVNVYMNELDQFIKRNLKIRYYVRYADDFAILHGDRRFLECVIPKISGFLQEKLKLALHPDKLFIKTLASGVDFLGWVHFPKHRVLRTSTKKRMFKKLKCAQKPGSIQSYLGMLSHGQAYELSQEVLDRFSIGDD
jgi:retron-type reverse transcriptase